MQSYGATNMSIWTENIRDLEKKTTLRSRVCMDFEVGQKHCRRRSSSRLAGGRRRPARCSRGRQWRRPGEAAARGGGAGHVAGWEWPGAAAGRCPVTAGKFLGFDLRNISGGEVYI